MRVRDLLALTQGKPLNLIAKENLDVGEKIIRKALKSANCDFTMGKRGWYFIGNDESILDKSIYEFTGSVAKKNAVKKKKAIESGEKEMNLKEKEVKNERRRASFDLDAELFKQLKIKAVLEDKNIYELVEQAIKEFLSKS